jgi:hypothetical protein
MVFPCYGAIEIVVLLICSQLKKRLTTYAGAFLLTSKQHTKESKRENKYLRSQLIDQLHHDEQYYNRRLKKYIMQSVIFRNLFFRPRSDSYQKYQVLIMFRIGDIQLVISLNHISRIYNFLNLAT